MAITFGENAPFRCDIVGSFLRPDVLKQARADFEAGAIDANQLKTVELSLIHISEPTRRS